MRLVVDLQACQSPGSRVRGIGRYSLSLTQAMARRAGKHELIVALNGSVPDSVEWLRSSFEDILPAERVRSWQSIAQIAEAFHGGPARSQAAGELFRHAMAALQPDFLQISSLFEGLDSDVANLVARADEGLPTAVTFYDLIPLAQSDTYLAEPTVRDWYMRRVEQLKNAEVLLAISAYTKSEAVDLLGMDPRRIVNILGACDEIFRPVDLTTDDRAALHRRYGIVRPFVMYTGGFDPRKNIGNLIRAYAALPFSIRAAHQLLIVGSPPANERAELEAIRRECDLDSVDCVLTGFVPDGDLAALYSDCRLYAFPSLQEGFGLPALEAMSCGAVVVGAKLSSLPEVIGFKDALFDPRDQGDISAALQRGLLDEGFRSAFLEHSVHQVRRFTWDESARLAWDGLVDAHARGSRRNLSVQVPTLVIPPGADFAADGRPSAGSEGALVPFKATCELVEQGQPTWFLITDAASALQAWDVLFHRCIGIVWAKGVVLSKLVTELATTGQGRTMLGRIVEAEGAYNSLLKTEPGRIESITRTVEAWLQRTAASVDDFVAWPNKDETRLFAASNYGVSQALDRLSALPLRPPVDDDVWLAISRSLNDNRHVNGSSHSRLLVDVSQLVVHDARSGIQRVVRNILRQLLLTERSDLQIIPIYFDDYANCRYAHTFAWRFLGIEREQRPDEIVDWLPGDRFLGLDLSAHIIPFHPAQFVRLRDMGVRMAFVVYDLLPILRPDCFDPSVLGVFRRWYQTIAEVAEGIVCISKAVADEFVAWLDQAKPSRARPLQVGHFHLGADPEEPITSEKVDRLAKEALAPLGERSTVLMVSTIEPRKGYQQALEAFELLWSRGEALNLAIVGKAGWRTEELVEKIRSHSELGQRLHWFEAVSDEVLHALYQRADLLLSASEGEGFGLPLIEAAQHGRPLLVRDLPVFREVAGQHAGYFEGFSALSLADAIAAWFAARASGAELPQSVDLPWLTWRQSCDALLAVIMESRWDYVVGQTKRYWFPAIDHRMETQTGYFERGALVASPTAGFLIYGPYAEVHRGDYRLRVLGEISGPDPNTWLDVVSRGGEEVFFRGTFAEVSDDVDGLIFESTLHLNHSIKSLEIRVWSSGASRLRLFGFELVELEAMMEDAVSMA